MGLPSNTTISPSLFRRRWPGLPNSCPPPGRRSASGRCSPSNSCCRFSLWAETRSIVRGGRHRNASGLDRADRKLWVLQSVDTGPLFDVRGRCGLEAPDTIKVATRTRSTATFSAEEVCSCGDACDRSLEPGAAGGGLPAPDAVSRAADGRLRSGGSVSHHQWLRAFRRHDEGTQGNLGSGIG